MILYSFIIPVYNVGNYLEKCLLSILGQSYKNWEAILIDDGSTDTVSAGLCDEYEKKDSRIHTYHIKNRGSLMARRYGLKYAAGNYILFVDSDDYVHRNLLLEINKIILQNHCDLVIFRLQTIDRLGTGNSPIIFNEGTIIGTDGYSKELMWKKIVGSSELNTLYSKAIKKEIIDINTDYSQYAFLKSGTDLMQSLPILEAADKIYFTEKVLYYYQYNPTGISSLKKKQTDKTNIKLQIRAWNTLQNERLKYLKKLNYANQENLKIFYKFCFESLINMLTCWLGSSGSLENGKWLIKEVLRNQIISDVKKYIQIKDVHWKYKIIYKLIIKKSKKVEIPLMLLAIKNRLYNLLCNYLIFWKQNIRKITKIRIWRKI